MGGRGVRQDSVLVEASLRGRDVENGNYLVRIDDQIIIKEKYLG